MSGLDALLDRLWAIPGVRADFVKRVPGVELTTDKSEMLRRLEPWHRRSAKALGFDWNQMRTAEQVHRNDVQVVGVESSFCILGIDGLVSSKGPICLGIYVADCAAVYLVDQRNGAFGLLHSGKKGTEGNIVRVGIETMRDQCGSDPSDIFVGISPCIRPQHYEVDFAAQIRADAEDCGVAEVYDCGENTAEDLQNYYSYRIEKGKTGRMLALLGRL